MSILLLLMFAAFIASIFMRASAAKKGDAEKFRRATWLSFISCAVLAAIFLAQGIVRHGLLDFAIAALWGWNAWNGYRSLYR